MVEVIATRTGLQRTTVDLPRPTHRSHDAFELGPWRPVHRHPVPGDLLALRRVPATGHHQARRRDLHVVGDRILDVDDAALMVLDGRLVLAEP
jgi:hypothetical protein